MTDKNGLKISGTDMKNLTVPYLKIILLLTLFVGLIGAAQFILSNKIGIVNQHLTQVEPLASFSQRPSAESIRWSSPRTSGETSVKPSSWLISKPLTKSAIPDIPETMESVEEPVVENELSFQDHLAIQAELRLQSDVTYDGRYLKIGYPMGDVPKNIGVCTDVVIRSFRGLGIDLQQRVHEDMKRHFRSYPNKWNLTKPDSNIDHRRVPNLMTYFKRSGASLEVTKNPLDYQAGNIVAWDLGQGLVHIGIVSNFVSESTSNPLIVHNIGAGPQMNDMLFDYKIIGHYKYGEEILLANAQ